MNNTQTGFLAGLDARLDALGERMKKKELLVPTDLVGGLIFLAFGLVMLLVVIPREITVGKKEVVSGRAFPELLMCLMIACSGALVLGQIVRLARGQSVKKTRVNLLTEVRALLLFGIMLVYFFACQLTNFCVGSLIFAFLMLLFFRCKKPLYYAVTLGLALLIWAAFRFGLNVRF